MGIGGNVRGVPGQGAVDAWYQTLMDVELMLLDGTPFCGGAADIHKFFDQILREMVYKVVEDAGMPKQVVDAYRNYLENLNVYNSIGQTIGHTYRRKCGIPQGCPFSMAIAALLMRAWVVEVKAMGVQPKVLADDVLMVAQGRSMLKKYAKALNFTHLYLQDLGAKVAPTKSYNFSSTEAGRKWLKKTWWPYIHTNISVVKHMTYVGAHLSTTAARKNNTLVDRWDDVCLQLSKLMHTADDDEAKITATFGKVFVGTMYGIEGTDISDSMVGKIAAVVLDAFRSKHDIRDADWMFTSISNGSNKEVEPQVQILVRRCLELRGAICKRPKTMAKAKTILQKSVENSPGSSKWYIADANQRSQDPNDYPCPRMHVTRDGSNEWKRII